MKTNEIRQLFFAKEWRAIVASFSVNELCELLAFEEAIQLSYSLFHKNLFDEVIQLYAVNLANKIKEQFSDKWDADWKLDVFLGNMCEFVGLHHQQYCCYKRAYDKLQDPPDSLLLLLAGCINSDIPLMTEGESADYLQRALAKKFTYEAAVMMRQYFQIKANKLEVEYWNVLCDELEKNNVYVDAIIPDALVSIQSSGCFE